MRSSRTAAIAAAVALCFPVASHAQEDEWSPRIRALALEANVPGGAVVVVRDGRGASIVPLGVADATGRAVTAETVFRVASISKVFTATAAARLAAAGRVDLTADLRVGRPWLRDLAPGPPVTLRDLLTHTAGFDDRAVGMFARDASGVVPLAEYLAGRMPPRTTEPGRWTRYSNHGAALAGLVVEEATGLPFAEALRELVFAPLGMASSSFAQPIPLGLAARMARAFGCPDGRCEPFPLDYRHTVPAGAMVTSPADMALFLQTLLQPDTPLGADAIRLMTARAWAHRPELPGLALAWQEQYVGGQRALVHAGSSSGYRGLIALVPDGAIGLFAITTGGSSRFGEGVMDLLREMVGPGADAKPPPVGLPPDRRAGYAGYYLQGRAPRTSYESFPSRFLFASYLGLGDDGFLFRNEGGVVRRYGTIGDDLFRSADGFGVLGFERDSSGAVVAMHAAEVFNGIRYPASYERLSRWGGPGFLNELLSWTAGLPLLAFTAWSLVVAVMGLRRAVRAPDADPIPPPARRWTELTMAAATTAAIVTFALGFMARFNAMAANAPGGLAQGMPPDLARWLWLPWAIGGCSVFLTAMTVRVWVRPTRRPDRLLMSVVSVCAMVFTLILVKFDMLPPVG